MRTQRNVAAVSGDDSSALPLEDHASSPRYTVDVEFSMVPRSLLGRVLLGSVVLAMAGGIVLTALFPLAIPNRSAPSLTAPIRGGLALRVDLLRATRWPFADNGGFATGNTETDTRPVPVEPPPRTNPAAGSVRATIDLAQDFYQRLDSDPASALMMLSPALLDGQADEIVTAWHEVRSVSLVGVESDNPGALRTDVVATYPDGDRALLSLLLTLSIRSAPEITDASLLSARYYPVWVGDGTR